MASTGERCLAVTDETGAWIGVMESDDLLRAWQKGKIAQGRRRRVRRLRSVLRRIQRIGVY